MIHALSGRDGAFRKRRRGDCSPFADPVVNGLDADIFWRPGDCRDTLCAYVGDCRRHGFGSTIALGELQCRKALLKAVGGEQLLSLRDRRRTVQLRCLGEDIRLDRFSLEIVVDKFPGVGRPLRLVREFADLYGNRSPDTTDAGWTVEGMRHRDALMALDLRMAGLSYQQIAIVLYGEEAVERDWNNPDQTMKNRVIRSVKRGFRMMNGGYRQLLI